MSLFSQEHYAVLEMFEQEFKGEGRMDKEPKEIWSKGHIYQEGAMNQLFKAYRQGYALGIAVQRNR